MSEFATFVHPSESIESVLSVLRVFHKKKDNLKFLLLALMKLASIASVLSVLRVFYQKTDNLKFLLLAFMKPAWFILCSV